MNSQEHEYTRLRVSQEFIEMDAKDRLALEQFKREVEALSGDALLDRRISFEDLPAPVEGERDLRFLQSKCLERRLIEEFGLRWRKRLEERKSAA
jgi:hypothetical protein